MTILPPRPRTSDGRTCPHRQPPPPQKPRPRPPFDPAKSRRRMASGSTRITGCGTMSAGIPRCSRTSRKRMPTRSRQLAGVKPLREKLYTEILGRLKQDDASVPYFKNGYWYYSRYEPGKEHPIFARRPGSMDAAGGGHSRRQRARRRRARRGTRLLPVGRARGLAEFAGGSRSARTSSDAASTSCASRNSRAASCSTETIANVEADLAWANDNATVCTSRKTRRRCSEST